MKKNKKSTFSHLSDEVKKLKIQLFFMRSKIALGDSVSPHTLRLIKKSVARELSKKNGGKNA